MGKRNKGKRKGAQRTALKTEKKAEKRVARARAKYEETVEAALLAISGRDAETLRPVEVERPSPRQYCSLVAVPGRSELLMFGGELPKAGEHTFFRDLHRFNASKRSWTRHCTIRSPLPRCSHQCVCVLHGGTAFAFLFGGEFSSPDGDKFRHFGDLWRLDIDKNTWEDLSSSSSSSSVAAAVSKKAAAAAAAVSSVPKQPSARSGHRMTVYKKYLVLFGGFHEGASRCQYFNDLWLYDIDAARWALAQFPAGLPQPEPRSGCQLAVYGDELFVFGGFTRCHRTVSAAEQQQPSSRKKKKKKKNCQQEEEELDDLEAEMGVFLSDVWTVNLSQVVDSFHQQASSESASTSTSAVAVAEQTTTQSAARWEKVKLDGFVPTARTGMCSVHYKKHVHFFGGVCDADVDADSEGGGGGARSTFFADFMNFNLEKRKWFAGKIRDPEKLPSARYGVQTALIGSQMFMFGGIVESESGTEVTFDDLYSLDLKREAFETILPPTTVIPTADQEKEESDDDEGDEDKDEHNSDSSSEDEDEEDDEEEEENKSIPTA